MLYGRSSALVGNNTSPHFQLATEGVVMSSAASILYNYQGCLEPGNAACDFFNSNSTYYASVDNGLDIAIKALVYNVKV